MTVKDLELLQERCEALARIKELETAIAKHHSQKADDRCIEDDDALYVAAGLPPCDRRVGDKEAMLANCKRFIERRCEGGKWPSYVDLEERIKELEAEAAKMRVALAHIRAWLFFPVKKIIGQVEWHECIARAYDLACEFRKETTP